MLSAHREHMSVHSHSSPQHILKNSLPCFKLRMHEEGTPFVIIFGLSSFIITEFLLIFITYHKCIILLQGTIIFVLEDTFYIHFRLIEKLNTQD